MARSNPNMYAAPLRITEDSSPGYNPVAQAVGGQLYSPSENVGSMKVGGMDRLEAARRRGYDSDLSTDNEVDEDAVSLVAQRLIAGGEDPASARRRAREYVLLEKQNVRDSMPKPRTSSPADLSDGLAGAPQAPLAMDSGLGDTDEAGRDWSNWTPGMPLPPAGGRSMGPGDDSQRGPGYAKVPGPRLPNGQPATPGDVMYDPRAIEAYTTRPQLPDGQYAPSPEDMDYEKRGRKAVYNRDGSVSYSTGAYDETTTGRGAPGRAGVRPDLADAGWETTSVPGPTGNQVVYRPGETAKARYDAQSEARSNRRVRNAAGLSAAQAAGMSREELQLAAEDARDAKGRDREDAWRSQMMLAGGQATGGRGGSKAITNALMTLPEEQRNSSLRYMLPGGELAAGVDANSAKNAVRLLNAEMLGQGGPMSEERKRAGAAAASGAEAKLPTKAAAELERERNAGVLPASSEAGARLLREIEDEFIGPVALTSEVDSAIEEAVTAGVPRAEAEQYYARRRRDWSDWMGLGGEPKPAAGSGGPAPPTPPTSWRPPAGGTGV